MWNKNLVMWTLIILTILFVSSQPANACLSITDNFNSVNPVLNANFNLQPDVSPFTDCWTGIMNIRSKKKGWRLIATRSGPRPQFSSSKPQHNVKAKDIKLKFKVKDFGMANPRGAILVSPFSSETKLSSIGSGTLIISGIKKTSNSCSPFNNNYYKVTQRMCLFRDFVFNPGSYNGQVSFVLVRP